MFSTIIQQLTTDELNIYYRTLMSEYVTTTDEELRLPVWVKLTQISQELASRPTELATRIYGT